MMQYPAIVRPERGAFVVTFPDAPGCVTQVDDEAELLPMATEALSGWIDTSLDGGDAVAVPRGRVRAPQGARVVSVPVTPLATAVRLLVHLSRRREGVTRAALAARLGLSVTTVGRLERGEGNLSSATAGRVMAMLAGSVAQAPLVREAAKARYGTGERRRAGRGGR